MFVSRANRTTIQIKDTELAKTFLTSTAFEMADHN